MISAQEAGHRDSLDPLRRWPAMSGCCIRDWRPLRKSSLLGFARIELPSGMILSDVTILTGERGPWASPPSKSMVGRDGVAIKDDSGKLRYSPTVEFTSKEVRDRCSAGVIGAMQAAPPDVFE